MADYSELKEEGEGRSTHCAVLCCLGVFAVGGIAVQTVSWFFLGGFGVFLSTATLVVIFVLTVLTYVLTTFRVSGTTMNICNYWIPQIRYAIAGLIGSPTAGRDFYASLTKDDPYVGIGVGPNSTMLYAWEDVAKELASWGHRTADGTMKRENELGLTFLNSSLFPETGRIALGLNRREHAIGRPYIGKVCDGGRCSEWSTCDGSNGWNRTWLRSFFRQRLSVDSFNTADLVWWTSIILHKILCNMDIGDGEAKRFCMQMKLNVGQITTMPPRLFKCPFFNYVSGNKILECLRTSHVDQIKAALIEKSPHEFNGAENEEKLKYTSNLVMDGLLYAGGLSVPTALQFMLALFYMDDSPDDVKGMDVNNEDHLKNFMWETLRRYAPVGCVPRWVTNDGGETWHHQMAILEQAVKDPRVFPDPYEFKMGREGLNGRDNRRSLMWADPANVHNDVCHPDSRACPGKELSQEIIIAFWQEYVAAGPWEPAPGCMGISVGAYFPSTFTVKKSGR